MGKCKDCVFGQFALDPETGARRWQGYCIAMKKKSGLNYQHVEQHFNCSCNQFKPR